MSRWEDDLVDAFLADALDGDADAGDVDAGDAVDGGAVDAMVAALGTTSTPAAGRDALLAAAHMDGRFARFSALVGELLDLDEAGANALLDGIGRKESWTEGPAPGIEIFHIEGGPRVANAITGFVRVPQDLVFPEHRHLGAEVVLVVQGSFVDGVSGAIHRAGDVVHMPAESAHDFRARRGPALVYLVVVDEGVQIGDAIMRPDDPRM